MTTQTEEVQTMMDIKKSSTVEGRQGPQWELTVTWPWTVGQNTDRTWLEKSEYPQEVPSGRYPVSVVHRGVKNKREGGQHDGSKPWMWNWAVVRFLAPQDGNQPASPAAGTPETSQTTGTATPATYEEQNVRGYDLGMAFNKAVDIAIAETAPPAGSGSLISLGYIRLLRDRLLHEVILIPPAPPHWCYDHETLFDHTEKSARAARFHMVEGGWCVENYGLIEKQEG